MSEPNRAFSDSIDIGVLGNELITDILSEI
jgi:hypothetical protein